MATAHNEHKGVGVHAGSATHLKQYENLKTLLKNSKSTAGSDLFNHLQEVFKKLILHYPDQALDKLEEVSYLLKHNGESLRPSDFLVMDEKRSYEELAVSQQEYIEKLILYYKVNASYLNT